MVGVCPQPEEVFAERRRVLPEPAIERRTSEWRILVVNGGRAVAGSHVAQLPGPFRSREDAIPNSTSQAPYANSCPRAPGLKRAVISIQGTQALGSRVAGHRRLRCVRWFILYRCPLVLFASDLKRTMHKYEACFYTPVSSLKRTSWARCAEGIPKPHHRSLVPLQAPARTEPDTTLEPVVTEVRPGASSDSSSGPRVSKPASAFLLKQPFGRCSPLAAEWR